MQKLARILENQVQWITLGLAVLFMAWVIWAYAINSQVAVQLGNKPVQPGNIDEQIVKGPVSTLKQAMQSPEEIAIAVPDLLDPWFASVNGPAKTPDRTQSVIDWNANGPDLSKVGPAGPRKNAAPIDRLVTAPPAVPVAISQLRTTVEYPDPKQPPPANNTHAQPVMVTANMDVVSVLFKVEIAKLAKEFNDQLAAKANIPAVCYETAILKVDLIREEKLPDGKWGDQTTIKPLIIHPLMDFPGDVASRDKAYAFKDWALNHADEILHPDFYQTAQGAPAWHRPDQQVDATKAPVRPVIAPAPPAYAPPNRSPGAGPNRFDPRGTSPYGRGAGGYPRYPAPVPGVYPGAYPGGYPGAYPGHQPGSYARPPSPYSTKPDASSNAGFGKQGGLFDPTQLQNDIEILAHDDTVKAGKTYRYRLAYQLYNSLYDINVISKPEIARQFAIPSKPSEPTEAVTIPNRTNFFVKSITSNEVRFDVFTWDGVMKVKEVRASPGDSIGKTDWSVVDIRRDRKNETYVLISDDGGDLQRRDFRADQDNPDYKNLLDQVKAAASAR